MPVQRQRQNQRRVVCVVTVVAFVVSIYFFVLARRQRKGGEEFEFYSDNKKFVNEAPEANLSQTNAVFTDARGKYMRFETGSANAPYLNVVFSKKGSMRSGDIHKCWQVNYVANGKALLTTLKPFGKPPETTETYESNHVIRIPPHAPHIFSFVEDTLFTENWENEDGSPCEFKAWFYLPFRKRISAKTLVRTD